MEMMEEAEVPDASDDTEKTDSDGGQDEEEEEDEYRCKHYRRKCQFVVSANWFVYIISVVFVVFIIFKSHGPP